MADETTRNEQGQFGRLDQADMPTYKRVRAAQIAGKDPEEDDDEPADEPSGKEETQREYNEKREKKQGGGIQKKIDGLIKQRSLARKEAEELRQRIAQYERGEAPAAPEPSEEQQTELQRAKDRHHARVEHARKNIPDYEKRVAAAEKIMITYEMGGKIIDLDNGPEVSLYLLEHPEISKDLHKLPTAKAIEAISKIAWKLEMESAQDSLAEKIAKKIPPPTPIKPLNGGGHHGPRPLRDLSQAEYKLARAKGQTKW